MIYHCGGNISPSWEKRGGSKMAPVTTYPQGGVCTHICCSIVKNLVGHNRNFESHGNDLLET